MPAFLCIAAITLLSGLINALKSGVNGQTSGEMIFLITYAAARFGNPPNYVQLKDSYDEQKAQLMHATGYTNYGNTAEESEDGEDDSHDEG